MIITLCGSARFESDFKSLNEQLTLAGHTVFSLSVYPSDKAGVKGWYTDAQKVELDAAHKRKIDASEAIVIVGDGYIGDSTASEILWAMGQHKGVFVKGAKKIYGPSQLYNPMGPLAIARLHIRPISELLPPSEPYFDILLDNYGDFIKVESPQGTSVKIGTWVNSKEYDRLRITLKDVQALLGGQS